MPTLNHRIPEGLDDSGGVLESPRPQHCIFLDRNYRPRRGMRAIIDELDIDPHAHSRGLQVKSVDQLK
jgi:hypothetical protein